jgi:hypothetical protein
MFTKKKTMKKFFIFSLALIAISIFQSCSVALPARGIERPAERTASEWTVVGSVRYEAFSKLAVGVTPYDKLLELAHAKFGDTVDIIEIKEDKVKLDALTKAQMLKDKKGSFTYKFVYNALVIKYD